MPHNFLVIDQGTSSTRAMIIASDGKLISQKQFEITQHFPKEGYVEHDAEEIWNKTYQACCEAIKLSRLNSKDISAIGITNQRETTVLWDKNTGECLHNAIVWQDRRTAKWCRQLQQQGYEEAIRAKTGLLLDPYFSASKIKWLLDNVPAAARLAATGDLAFGTIDSFLLWRLTGGKQHATDATNAARTLLFNIGQQCWDEELLTLFDIPASLLPTVLDCDAHFGESDKNLFGATIPITGMAGDQQAATVGQACFAPGMLKSTYGTGAFLLLNTGEQQVVSQNRLLTTIAYRLKGQTTYGLEGSIFNAGTTVKWLRDNLKIITDVNDTAAIAASVTDNGSVYFIPAFTGLGAPYWQPEARAAILGLTRDSHRGHIVRAALESVGYQTKSLLNCMQKDAEQPLSALRVDGGMVVNDWLLQFLADMVRFEVQRAELAETTALGAAYLAGLGAGVYDSLEEIAELWQAQQVFRPQMPAQTSETLFKSWNQAIQGVVELVS